MSGGHNPYVKHGACNGRVCTPEYRAWRSIRARLVSNGPKVKPFYKDRGVKMCGEWNDFRAFLEHMGPRPSPSHTVDRIDNSKGYEPGNCRWADVTAQANNRRNNVFIELDGERLTVAQWEARLGVSRGMVYARLRRGISDPRELLSTDDRRFSRQQTPRERP